MLWTLNKLHNGGGLCFLCAFGESATIGAFPLFFCGWNYGYKIL